MAIALDLSPARVRRRIHSAIVLGDYCRHACRKSDAAKTNFRHISLFVAEKPLNLRLEQFPCTKTYHFLYMIYNLF